jgi:hypothetical protein
VIAAPPPVSLAVSPPRLVVVAGETGEIEVTNHAPRAATVDASVSGLAVGLRGRPRIVVRHAAVRVRPHRLAIPPGRTATLEVSGAGRLVQPGDHAALVLLATRKAGRGVAVGVRVGVVVLLRGRGRVVHRLVPLALRRRPHELDLWLRNAGNVSEELTAARVRVRLLRGGRLVGRARVLPRELLPRTRGICVLRWTGRDAGRIVARVELRVGGHVVRRSFRLRPPRGP